MTPLQGIIAAISAVVLFLYGLQGFSRELQSAGVVLFRPDLLRARSDLHSPHASAARTLVSERAGPGASAVAGSPARHGLHGPGPIEQRHCWRGHSPGAAGSPAAQVGHSTGDGSQH